MFRYQIIVDNLTETFEEGFTIQTTIFLLQTDFFEETVDVIAVFRIFEEYVSSTGVFNVSFS